jgi:hypothetical protein
MTDSIGDTELFCAIVEAGGISAGARSIEVFPARGQPPPGGA